MRFSSYINNAKCLEWGLNANQGALFDLLNQAVSWAQEVIIDGVVYYWVSRNEVIKELPLFYSKPDTVYRHFVALDEKGLIKYLKQDGKDLIQLTTKGKTWNEFNSDFNPNFDNKLGNRSEKTRIEIRKCSDLNPTNNNTNNKNTNKNNIPPTPKTSNNENLDLSAVADDETAPPENKNSSSTKTKNPSVDYQAVMDVFNQTVADTPIRQIRVLTDKRKRAIHSLAKLFKKEFGGYEPDVFKNYFTDFVEQANEREDKFYYGGGKTQWVANFDYIIRTQTAVKALENAL